MDGKIILFSDVNKGDERKTRGKITRLELAQIQTSVNMMVTAPFSYAAGYYL